MEHLNLFYRGAYTNTVYTCRYDGHNWTGNTSIISQPGNIAVVSPFNPSPVEFNNRIYLFYRANEGPELCCAWYDGTRWYGGQPIHTMNGGINPKSNHSPNVTVYRSTIFLTYLDPQGYDVYTAWFDGTKWGGNTKISSQNGGITPRSTVNPAICTYKDQLYIVYPGEWTGNLYSAWFNGAYWDGNTEIADQPGDISPASSYTPGIGVYENRLIIVYLGAHLNNLYSASFNGSEWSGNTKISDQPGGISPKSEYNPTLASFSHKLYLAYRGNWVSTLYTATFDGTFWAGNTTISSQPGGIDPGSAYTPGICVSAATPGVQPNWMEKIPDATPLGSINIPGTHDSAAINAHHTTPYACQNHSISEQLELGIRMLDVRLKVKKDGSTFHFITCHGSLGSSTGTNEYQSFPSLLTECEEFLDANAKETILMSIKVDDWSNSGNDKAAAYASLQSLLAGYPTTYKASMPTLGECRGKIFLYNRINTDMHLGVPIGWHDNTTGSYASLSGSSGYTIYVQDNYEDLPFISPGTQKTKEVTQAFTEWSAGNAVWNFASATRLKLFGVQIIPDLLTYFGAKPAAQRPAHFGWLLLDYAFNQYATDTYGALDLVTLIIASNFGYHGYDRTFRVVGDGKGDL